VVVALERIVRAGEARRRAVHRISNAPTSTAAPQEVATGLPLFAGIAIALRAAISGGTGHRRRLVEAATLDENLGGNSTNRLAHFNTVFQMN
jgi:hypothetical protein